MVTQQDLDFILDCQVRELYNILATNYSLCIDIQTSTLIINVSIFVSIAELEAVEKEISIAAYLKLGCKKVSFYCCQNWLYDYNSDIRDEFDNMITSVLSSQVETQSELDESIQQLQFQVAVDWISFDGIAQIAGCSRETVNNEVQDYGIFVTLHQNNLGLSGENLEIYLNRRHTQTVEKFRSILTRNVSTSTATPSRAAAKLKAVPDTNEFVPTSNGGLSLPDNFDIMAGRKRRPDVITALKIAIAALPDGKNENIKKMYVRQVAMRENVENFVGALASQFQSSAKFKSVSQTSKEIYSAARQLWDEYLDSATA